MKNTFFAIFLFLISFNVYSQTKTGTIDIDFILFQMPEIETVQKNLQEYGVTLDNQMEAKMSEYQKKLDEYNASVESMTEQQMQEKQTAIFTLEDEIAKFRQNGIQLMRIREDELKRPLFQKIAEALDIVANEQQFTQIFNTSSDNNIVFLDPNYDVTLAVLEKMGIKIEIQD